METPTLVVQALQNDPIWKFYENTGTSENVHFDVVCIHLESTHALQACLNYFESRFGVMTTHSETQTPRNGPIKVGTSTRISFIWRTDGPFSYEKMSDWCSQISIARGEFVGY